MRAFMRGGGPGFEVGMEVRQNEIDAGVGAIVAICEVFLGVFLRAGLKSTIEYMLDIGCWTAGSGGEVNVYVVID